MPAQTSTGAALPVTARTRDTLRAAVVQLLVEEGPIS
ncbi:transcriptional regulator, partial [Rhodococcus hoagii]|nr:transcriptional regulator [Prescottella equi]